MNINQINKSIFMILLGLALAPPTDAAQYVYDDLNRLIQVIYDTGKTLNYTYDPAGNLLSITTTGLQTYTIEGQVTDHEGQPIPEVLITINDRTVLTDDHGHYQLTDLPAGDYTLMASREPYHFSPKAITVGEDQPTVINLVSSGPTDCLLYAVHDEGRSDTQLFTVAPSQSFAVQLLGQLHQTKDIEALDIHPTTNQLFAAAGDDGTPPGMLYTVNTSTGELFPVNQTGTGFNEINGLSFQPDGTLWAFAELDGLIQIDPTTGLGTLKLPYDGPIEDITWDNQGRILYGIQKNRLLAYFPETGDLTQLNCQLPGFDIEALEMRPDGRILFAIHNDQNLSIHALDIETGQLAGAQISTLVEGIKLNDIEGIAWPIEACSN